MRENSPGSGHSDADGEAGESQQSSPSAQGYEGAGVEEGGGYQRSAEGGGGYERSGQQGEDYDPRREGEDHDPRREGEG